MFSVPVLMNCSSLDHEASESMWHVGMGVGSMGQWLPCLLTPWFFSYLKTALRPGKQRTGAARIVSTQAVDQSSYAWLSA